MARFFLDFLRVSKEKSWKGAGKSVDGKGGSGYNNIVVSNTKKFFLVVLKKTASLARSGRLNLNE